MEAIEQHRVSILELARGALSEEVNVQLSRVAENLLDPNTDWKKPRKIQITLDFVTDEQREIHRVTASTTTKLAPYRTFPEVEQPESPFVFRLQSGGGDGAPSAALFEADGTAWRLEAIGNIRQYFETELPTGKLSSGEIVILA